jgi:hypothetical protein
MKRLLMPTAFALILAVAISGVASAISANINPLSQTHAHGVKSAWSLTWGGVPGSHGFDVYFWYDVNNDYPPHWVSLGTFATSASKSTAWWPCTTTTFYQELDVYDQYGAAGTTSHATESGGNPC